MKNIFLIIICVAPLIIRAQKNYSSRLDQYTSAYAGAYDFHGVVLVAQKDKIIYQKAFGQANREWTVPNTVNTRFPIASLTKQFTATAVLQLAEQEKLSVTDKLSKFFPNYPKGDSITLHMLLNHTSGISEYSRYPNKFKFNNGYAPGKLKDTLLALFQQLPFDFSPGTYWRYSNTGYLLLGYIIEQASGQSYANYVYPNLLQKAGMQNSGIMRQDSIILNKAYGYVTTANGAIPVSGPPFNIGFSDGGLFSTAGDLFAWSLALNNGKVISKESLAKQNEPNRPERGAGYGVFIDKFFDRKVIFHTGNIPGFSSVMIYYPGSEIRIVILANRETNLDFLPKGIAAIMFDKQVMLPYKHKPFDLNKEVLHRYIASFETPFPFSVKEKNGRLFMDFGRQVPLIAESETKFYVSEPDVDIQLEYVLNDKKEIDRVYFIEAGVKTEAKIK